MSNFNSQLRFAIEADVSDPLSSFKFRFHFPIKGGKEVRYYCGNSLGLQPLSTKSFIQKELDKWAENGVDAHFLEKENWYTYHRLLANPLANLLGALPTEVVAMGSLSANLHHLLLSFYKPTQERFKIIIDENAFPSDRFIIDSQVRLHGFDPENAVVELKSSAKNGYVSKEDIKTCFEKHGNEIAVVCMSGVQYATGQYFDLEFVTQEAHKYGAKVGFDLAHAIGNVFPKLHDWNVDFATWCSYKYLNSGPGGIAGIFIHENAQQNYSGTRLEGWWGAKEENRFSDNAKFVPAQGAEAWQLSNAPILLMASLRASLEIFEEVPIEALAKKRDLLSGYAKFLIKEWILPIDGSFILLTPESSKESGGQVSLLLGEFASLLNQQLNKDGFITDFRSPNVLRFAFAPLYNSFEDVYFLIDRLKQLILGK